jgi:KDO2-lipid IV(A) lauroyltransferase
VKYRRKLVSLNLRNSFPEKSDKEIKNLQKQFYHFLCDYFVETLKMVRMTKEEIGKRMKFTNPDMINELTKTGNSCLLSLGHYGNWEWVTSIGLYIENNVKKGQVYKRLNSRAFDEFFLLVRERCTTKCIEMNEIYRTIILNKKEGNAMVIGFLSDQHPPRYQDEYWTTFLNQDTLTLTGLEQIAAKMGFAIVYLDVKRIKRGYYEGAFKLITTDASKEPKFSIMEKYMRNLEQTILYDPAYYLWSHNKWKFKKQRTE